MENQIEKMTEYAKQHGFLVQFAIMCTCVFAIIMWAILAVATCIWVVVILMMALTNGAVTLLWLVPWSFITAVLITALLAVLEMGIFD